MSREDILKMFRDAETKAYDIKNQKARTANEHHHDNICSYRDYHLCSSGAGNSSDCVI